FNPEKTVWEDFELRDGSAGNLERWAAGNTEVAGIVQEGARQGFQMLPAIYASATPKGRVDIDAFDRLTGILTSAITKAQHLDGVLLALHGAMYTAEFPHADEEIVRRVRKAIGPHMPLVVTHDFHANVSPEIVALTSVLLTYQQCPHLDTKARGERAASIMGRMLRGEIRPRQAVVNPPVLWNIVFHNTYEEPLKSITQASIELERRPGILAASVACGYQYNDVPYMGPSVIVATNDDADLARREAQRLADMMLDRRDRIRLDLPDAATAVRDAIASETHPVALFEAADNIGGGAPGDQTFILEELLKQGAQGWVVTIYDPAAVAAAKSAGIDGKFEQAVGGWSPGSPSKPVSIRGAVRSLHAGRFIEPEIRHGGQRYWNMGHAAVIEAEGSTPDNLNLLVVTAERSSPNSLHELISCGIYPERQKILVAKGTIAPRAAYEPVASRIVLVNTPGTTAVDPRQFVFHNVRDGIL
ncbi:MAG: M81 family metallopeptidase, partial [Acidobacteriota bacterium]|nr:M81 family metallopeptidase [Acidobacteriota bacterium]